jgi:hypothetical protein
MASVDDLRRELRLTDAPLVRAGLAQTIAYFRDILQVDPMEWLKQLQGVDYHKPVRVTMLRRNTSLVRYDDADDVHQVRTLKPFAYFTKPGVSPFHLGISYQLVGMELQTVQCCGRYSGPGVLRQSHQFRTTRELGWEPYHSEVRR